MKKQRRTIKSWTKRLYGIFKEMNPRRRNALIAATIVFSGVSLAKDNKDNNDVKDGTAYVSTVKNDRDVKIYGKDGEIIENLSGNDAYVNKVISKEDLNDRKGKKLVYVNNDDGNLIEGYIDSSNLSKESSEIKNFFNSEDSINIAIVSAQNGVFLRQNKKVDRQTDNAELLSQGTYVLCGTPETSSDNAYTWRKIIYYKDGEQITTGYMVDDYLLDIDNLDKYNNLEVTYDFLNVRETPNVPDNGEANNYKYRLEKGNRIYVLPNTSGVVDENYDWLPIAYKNTETNAMECGWIAGMDRIYDKTYVKKIETGIEEITNEDSEEIDLNNPRDTRIRMLVDTSSDNNADLKMRETPGLESEIKMKLENGTTVYVTEEYIDQAQNSGKVDGYNWIKVIAENGETGYVAKDYLVEFEKMKKQNKTEYRKVDIPGIGEVEGVLVIDSSNLSVGQFEEVLTGKANFSNFSKFLNDYGKPAGVMIKIGATAFGNKGPFQILEERQKARELIMLCEKLGVPYGSYYYSQAINKNETDEEIDYITSIFSGMGELKYNILGCAIDIENDPNEGDNSRSYNFAKKSKENKKELTELKMYMREVLIEELGQEVIIYSNKNDLKDIININDESVPQEVRDRLWLVNPINQSYNVHADGLNRLDVLKDSSMWQYRLDYVLESYTGDNRGIDISYMTKERYEALLKEHGLISEFTFEKQEDIRER